MSLHGNFERLDQQRGFEFQKDEFGAGNFRLKATDNGLKVEEDEESIATVEADLSEAQITRLEYELIDELGECDNGELFLEVIGGADYLKDFLEKLINEEPRSN